ncbi:hypothetical protein CERSUDRAFT_160283 [Gelatoporia subvermispora B]|uniref:Uncharacterized protein n=1 Tax=Ceriporiopsis subvermispora (strain B) TaxID=914234 RepID=M2R5C5_CERS8|nr:hypothetical protein CERSUDRAFT_160283 [Gelatoporia subvermispora B]
MSSPRPLTVMQYVLPDLFKLCPLHLSISPHYLQATLESTAWINSFSIFTGTEFDFFIKGGANFSLRTLIPMPDTINFVPVSISSMYPSWWTRSPTNKTREVREARGSLS